MGSKGPQCCPWDMSPPPGVPWKGHGRHHGLDLTAVLLTRHKQGGVSQGIEGGFWGSGNCSMDVLDTAVVLPERWWDCPKIPVLEV